MESPGDSAKNLCRVCNKMGLYDLCEMKFRCDDIDVLLIDAYNSFSACNNDSFGLYLCEICTESLTLAYSFWQQIKRADEKFIDRRRQKSSQIEQSKNDANLDSDSDDGKSLMNSDELVEKINTEDEPIKKYRKRKMNPVASSKGSKTKIGTNIALPHFEILNFQLSEEESSDPSTNNMRDEEHSQSGSEPHKKHIKTLKPSAVIPADLERIKELLGMSPLDSVGDQNSIYKCNHCPKAFAAPHHLMIHMRKSHLCQYCLATFSKVNDLYTHVKEVHRTFECLLCSKEFQSNGNLRQHMRKNHSIFLPAHISLLNICDLHQPDTS